MSHTYRLVVEFESDHLLSNAKGDSLVSSVIYDIMKKAGATVRRCELGNGYFETVYAANDAPEEAGAFS